MICAKCDELDRRFIEPGANRTLHCFHGTLTPELEERFEAEERARRNAIFEHRYKDHDLGDKYE
jgi:hypothetical protein